MMDEGLVRDIVDGAVGGVACDHQPSSDQASQGCVSGSVSVSGTELGFGSADAGVSCRYQQPEDPLGGLAQIEPHGREHLVCVAGERAPGASDGAKSLGRDDRRRWGFGFPQLGESELQQGEPAVRPRRAGDELVDDLIGLESHAFGSGGGDDGLPDPILG